MTLGAVFVFYKCDHLNCQSFSKFDVKLTGHFEIKSIVVSFCFDFFLLGAGQNLF